MTPLGLISDYLFVDRANDRRDHSSMGYYWDDVSVYIIFFIFSDNISTLYWNKAMVIVRSN